MNFIDKMVERFIKLNRRMKRWQRVVSVMAAVVVFATTYALILPAITLDTDTATTQAGIEVAASENEPDEAGTVFESEEEEEPAAEENVREEEPEETVEEENSSSESGSQDAEVAEASKTEAVETDEKEVLTTEEAVVYVTTEAAVAEVTGQTEEEIRLITEDTKLAYETDDYVVYADFGESAKLPEGVRLRVKEITKDSDPEAYEMYYQKALGEMQDKYDENTTLSFAKFYDIAFVYDDVEIEPSGNVNVRIEYKKAVEIEKNTTIDTIHFDKNDDEKAEVIKSDTEGSEKEVEAVEFESDRFSVYGVIGASLESEITLPGSDDTYEVTVTYGPEAQIPDGATLDITAFAVDSKEYKEAKEAIVAVKKAEDEKFNEKLLGFAALDISIKDAQGNKVEPAEGAGVKVSIQMKKLPETASEETLANTLEIQHLNETTGKATVETVAEVQDVTVAGGTAEAEFTITSFSTFTLTWGNNTATVHFGKMNGTEFEEFEEETINFDTSATSINIANNFDGYDYRDAVYCIDGQTIENGVNIDSIINKTSTGWEITQYITNEYDETVPSRVSIANGSDIYAVYFSEGSPNPSGAGDSSIPSPTTTKKVSSNGDGTYTIQLDITGATVTEDNSHYANILVILDATRSMNGAKWTNAKAAMKTLIETLVEGENSGNAGKIDFALVTFGRSATVTQNWTKDNVSFKNTCANINMVSTSGTNWEAGMRGGLYGVLNNMPDDDPTFVIFLTDGDPNVYYSSGSSTNYTNSGTTNGYSQNAATSANHSADEAKQIAASTYLYGIYCGDSGTTPSGDSFNRLVSVITGEGQGGQKTIAANANTIESEFKLIAETALESMGANNVSVDDGVPSLSSVSAQTVGEAGAFEYYIATGENPSDSDFATWTDAPGASYSNDNGVTWDLSKVGTLPEKTTYRLKFTVWPSQDAYDLIADLNNGVVTMTDEQLEEAGIEENDGVYTLKTNTHLETTYTFKGQAYTDPNTLVQEHMLLPTEQISIKKIWNNAVDSHIGDDTSSVQLYLTKDGENYLYGDNAITVGPGTKTEWVSTEDIYISCGLISQESDGSYTIREPGHDYSIAEPESFSYYWNLTSDVYRPMSINGTAHYLVLNDDATGSDGSDYYVIEGHKYEVRDGDSELTATNDRRSNLNLTKVIDDKSDDQGADKDTLFNYTITVNDSLAETGSADNINSDRYVWFSVYDPVAGTTVKNLETSATAESGNTGYYYVESGSPFTVKIKAGWNLRFINLPNETTYTITETVEDGWAFEKAEGTGWNYTTEAADDYNINVSEPTVTGDIPDSNHSYTVTVTNKWEANKKLTVNKNWESGNFVTAHGTVTVALYKDGAVIAGTEREIADPATSVTYENISSLEGLEIREVIVTTEGTGDEAVTTVTPIDANGLITVSGETTTLGDGKTDTYVVTYAPGTASGNERTDTVTNTMPQLVVNKNDAGNNRLAGAVFKLTGEDGETALSGYGTITSNDSDSGNLLNGVYLSNGTYYLVETDAPDGYNKLAYKVKLVVTDNSAVITAVTDPTTTTNIADETSDNNLLYTFTIHNSNGVELPNAGGPGTLLYTLGGLMLILASALMYGFRMRRGERRFK